MKELTVEKVIEVAVGMGTSAIDAAQLHRNNVSSINTVKCKKKELMIGLY